MAPQGAISVSRKKIMHLNFICESKYDYCSTQFNIEDKAIYKLIDNISEEDLIEDGKENRPHITVKFGLYEADPQRVFEIVHGFGIVKAQLTEISLFKSRDREVVKIGIISNDLHRLNRLISLNFQHDNTYPNYIPHLTLAYVKPDTGDKYTGKHPLIGKRYTFNTLMVSDKDGHLTKIPLANISYT